MNTKPQEPITIAIENALLPALFHRSLDGVRVDIGGKAAKAKALHWQAIEAVLQKAPPGEREAASRELAIHRERIVTMCKHADRLGLVAYHIASILIEADMLTIGPDAFGQALDLTLPALEKGAGEDTSHTALKTARRVLQDLQRRGLYQGVTMEIAA